MKKRILVVENNPDILELITLVLNEEGYVVDVVPANKNIFEHIVSFVPHAILLDITAPTDAGTELCREIKAAEGTKHIPVIVLSTHPQIQKVKEVCADDVVEKPFDIDGLLEVLDEQLRKAS